jgi:DNA-binding Lrp family transcriptional regulator
VDLDEADRALLAALLQDADRSLRELADEAGVSPPTVAKRIQRLEAVDLLGPARREVDLARLGTLVLLDAPPDALEAMVDHEAVFQVHRTHGNRALGIALVDDLDRLHEELPRAETTVLAERVASRAPELPDRPARSTCSECGNPVEGAEARELVLGDDRYVACCPMCEQRLEERYEQHREGADPQG